MIRSAKSWNSIIILTAIAGLAVVLSIISYEYSSSTSNDIVDIASQEIRSNARIEVHDLSKLLANRLETINVIIQTLTDAPAIQNNEFQRSQVIINNRQNHTNDLTDFYMWLDQSGKIVWISNMNSTTYQKYKGFDLSYRPYFTVPKDTLTPYYSSLIESNDKIPRLYISYPILSKQGQEYKNTNNGSKPNVFQGTIVAAVNAITVGSILKSQLLPQFNSTISLVDNKGIILYADNPAFVGKYIFGKEFQSTISSLLPVSSRVSLNKLVNTSLKESDIGGTGDIYAQGKMNTLAFEPITLQGKHFLTLYISAPHNLASKVAMAIAQQKNLSTIIIIAIGIVALGAAFLVLNWNKKLEGTVNARTAELRRANEQLKNHDQMQKEFINVAAHELRTPIQPVLALSDILRSKIKDKEQVELLDVILRNVKRLQRLSQVILDVTMIESHSLKLNKHAIDLNDLIVNIIQDHQNVILKSDGKVKLEYEIEAKGKEGKQIFVEADRERIAQVVWNLLTNALKFTKDGTITVSTRLTGREVIVTVRDTGEGIDPKIQPRLFSKFATSSIQGTGLGLYISKSIVEAHGGSMWAENKRDRRGGATFYFSLPVIDRQEVHHPQ
ncbi:MAG TPA: sensor histidine kinase [Nitrososphaeraceae archaeon]|nr:sensor histidine kinase [Nitrososphaeraceae archaeon]